MYHNLSQFIKFITMYHNLSQFIQFIAMYLLQCITICYKLLESITIYTKIYLDLLKSTANMTKLS